jgi:flagellar biosynthesis protein FlhG
MTHSTRLKRALVLAVTSGKGGVGKTNLAINVSVALAHLGHRVAVIDGDFGLGNVGLLLGLTAHAHVGHLISGERSLAEVLIEGPRGLKVLLAGSGVPSLTALSPVMRDRFNTAVEQARASFDFIVIDTAPGISDDVVGMLRLAHHVLLVTSLDPAALVNAYALAKVLWRTSAHADIGLIANGVRDSAEGRLAFRQIDRAAARFLGHHLRYFGYVPSDPAVRDAVLHQAALVDYSPQAPASRCYRLLANRLATLSTGPGGVRLLPGGGPAEGEDEVSQCA